MSREGLFFYSSRQKVKMRRQPRHHGATFFSLMGMYYIYCNLRSGIRDKLRMKSFFRVLKGRSPCLKKRRKKKKGRADRRDVPDSRSAQEAHRKGPFPRQRIYPFRSDLRVTVPTSRMWQVCEEQSLENGSVPYPYAFGQCGEPTAKMPLLTFARE